MITNLLLFVWIVGVCWFAIEISPKQNSLLKNFKQWSIWFAVVLVVGTISLLAMLALIHTVYAVLGETLIFNYYKCTPQ